MEWLVVENILKMDEIQLDKQTRYKLMQTFKKYYDQEIQFRHSMVKKLETRLELAKQGTPTEMLDGKFDDSKLSAAQLAKKYALPTKKELDEYEMISVLDNT